MALLMLRRLPAPLLLCATFAACSGDPATGGDASGDGSADTTATDSGGDDDATADTGAPATPTFTAVKTELLTPGCTFSTCHGGRRGAAGLDLATDPYTALVGVEAQDAPGRILVVPGDPAASYLMEKLTSDTPAAGERMPSGSPLDAERTELVRSWIAAGAPNN